MEDLIKEHPTTIKLIVPFDEGDFLSLYVYCDNNTNK